MKGYLTWPHMWYRQDVLCLYQITTSTISTYHHNSSEFVSCLWHGVLDTTLCNKVCQWLAAGRWFSPDTPVSSTNKTDHQDITEILLKVALIIISHILSLSLYFSDFDMFCLNMYLCKTFQHLKNKVSCNYWSVVAKWILKSLQYFKIDNRTNQDIHVSDATDLPSSGVDSHFLSFHYRIVGA